MPLVYKVYYKIVNIRYLLETFHYKNGREKNDKIL